MARASRYETWPVRGKLQGKNGKKSRDVSGIDCATAQGFPRAGLVIDDNLQEAQFVTVKNGEIVAGDMISLIDNRFEGKDLELDGEGVAYANGYFYVIGSHGHPRHSKGGLDPEKDAARIAAQIAANSQIVRFRSDGVRATGPIERTAKLRAVIARQPDLRSYRDQRLENNGLTIEGIAVRGGRILVGFRGPQLRGGRAAVLSVAVNGVFGKTAADPRLHRLPLGKGTTVRDLAAFGDGVLVLAGPIASGPGLFGIYWWDGESDSARLLKDLVDIVGKKGNGKPEALLPLDEDKFGLRLLVLFDGAKEAAPVVVAVPRPGKA
jgi:hypothetical protein